MFQIDIKIGRVFYDVNMCQSDYCVIDSSGANRMAKTPTEMADRFMLRMPPNVRERLAEEAQKAGRSLNAEIVARLEKSLERGNVEEILDAHEERLDEYERWNADHNGRIDALEALVRELRSDVLSMYRGG
jgi:16S rRNA C967 or C1407 C5-methylase (RsmB/RsmF family)